jgi:ArsR family transcriptional regulator
MPDAERNPTDPPAEPRLERLVEVLKAAADPVRLRILRRLRVSPCPVKELVQLLGLSQPDVSHHLRRLRLAGLVTPARKGRETHYGLPAQPEPEAAALLRLVLGPWEPGGTPGSAPQGKGPARVEKPTVRPAPSPPPAPGEIEDYLL